MPPRLNILDDFISAIEGLVERPTPAPRQPMRGAGSTGPQAGPDLEAARRAAGPARASAEGAAAVQNELQEFLPVPESRGSMAARASTAGAAAIRQEFEALISQAQANPETRFRGELRPDVRSTPPSAVPPTGLQNAPLSTQQLQGVMQRTGRQAQRPPSPATRTFTGSDEAKRLAAAERLRANEVPDRPRLPTPAQTSTRQALTPSQATQPQTARVSPTAQPVNWEAPAAQQFFDTHMRTPLGMNPQQFEQYYFAGYVRQASIRVAGSHLHVDGTVRAPQDMVARNAQGREIRVPSGTYLGAIRRQFIPRERTVYNAYFALDSQYQGMGVAKQIFRNQIDVYRRMGNIDKVTVSAGLDGGGHTWARFGFVPDRADWISNRQQMLSRLRGVTNLDPAHRALAESIIRRDNPIYARALAGMPMAAGAQEGVLGRKLMAGTHWHGTLDLRNPRDMNYFDAYVAPRSRQ